jgi:hypothetical protein
MQWLPWSSCRRLAPVFGKPFHPQHNPSCPSSNSQSGTN